MKEHKSRFLPSFSLSQLISNKSRYPLKEKPDTKIVQFWFFETRNGDPTKAPLTSW